MTQLDQAVRVPETVLVRIVNGEAVLLNLESEDYFGLDEVSTDFWHALMKSTSLAGALDLLSSAYDATEDVLSHDLLEFVQDLETNGLVTLSASSDA